MAGIAEARLIESFYAPDQIVTAGAGRRLAGYVLDVVLQAVTLYIGWLIGAAIVAARGQTPGKQLLSMYVIREDGTRAGGAFTFFVREVVIKGILFTIVATITLGVGWLLAALWCLWDRNRQCLWDKVGDTYVAYSSRGFRPLTADEMLQDLRRGTTPAGYQSL